MAIFQIQAKDAILHINQFATLNAVQSFNWDPAFNEEYFNELGNENYSAQAITPEISGSFESNATGSTIAIMHRMLQKFNVGTGAFEGYTFATGTPNEGTMRAADFEHLVFDLIEAKRATEVFTRSTLLPRCFISSWSLSASVDGAATETYNFEGDLAEVYRSPFHDLFSVPLVRVTGTTATTPAGWPSDVPTGVLAGTTYTIMKLFLNNEEIAVADVTATINAGITTVDITGSGLTIAVGDRIHAILAKDTPGAFPTIYNPTDARFVKADKITIYLVDVADVDISALADGDLNIELFDQDDRFLRVQSADINVDMRREVLREIAYNERGSSVYYRGATYPLQVTANLTAFETDLNDWARIQVKRLTDMNATFDPADILNLKDFEGKEWQIVIRMWYGTQIVQTTVLANARVTGRGSQVAVEGRSEVTWAFTGSNIIIEGSDTV